MKPQWFESLINPWNDPGLVRAIDRSVPIVEGKRRVEDLALDSKKPVSAGEEKNA